MDGKYQDSYVSIYHGPRRGGKTVSMTMDTSVDMINGRRCFSNYPIIFEREDENGVVKSYESEPINTDELLFIDRPEIKKKYDGSVVAWDESALSLFSRDFMQARNKMMGLVITLIGKLEMNFYFNCQFLSLLDKNIKLQMDALIFCHDLSFKMKQYERGSRIGQSFQDISGRFTGEMFEYSNRLYYQTFQAKPFWLIYNTKQTFAIFQEKIREKDIRAGVVNYEAEEYMKNATEEEIEEMKIWSLEASENAIDHAVAELLATKNLKVRQSILLHSAVVNGFQGDGAELGLRLIRMGAKEFVQAGVFCWDLSTVTEVVGVA